jgi:hypothetical protein
MSRLLTAACAAAALACVLAAPAAEARPGGPAIWHTVPPIPHARFLIDGKLKRADAKGRIALFLPGVKTKFYPRHIHPQGQRLSRDSFAHFARWYGKHHSVTYNLHYRIRFTFQDLADARVDPRLVSSMTLKSRTGVRTNVGDGREVWLQGSRVVPFAGELVSKDIDYQVERAYVDGANVVNRAQQRFAPSKTHVLPVRLLFYSLKVVTRDVLFGFPIGKAVELRYPSGRTVRHDLEGGKVSMPSLPRGTYNVKVVAPGISFTRPVSVSRNQQVELKVVSYLDMIVTAVLLFLVAFVLLAVRRPAVMAAIRRRLRRRRPAETGRD